MGNFNQSERRAHTRFRVKEGAFAVIKEQQDTKITVGQVIDISEGGLAFKYMAKSEPVKADHKLDIYFSGQGIQLKDISFRIISDFGIESSITFSPIFMRRGCLQFQKLTQTHRDQLNKFIQKYTDVDKN